MLGKHRRKDFQSLPVRGAWVEIGFVDDFPAQLFVAPRAGSVG